MDLLLDTHILLWVGLNSARLSRNAREAIEDDVASLSVSAVTAWEYSELNRRGRFGADLPLGPILDALDAMVLDFPGNCWTYVDSLPELHRDPVDRMLIAHALATGHTLVTADAIIHAYPVPTLW